MPLRSLSFKGVLLLLMLGTALARAQETPHPLSLEQHIALLEDPERDRWQKPDQVVQALNIQKGQVVADVGAGSGYFTLRFARAVGPEGTVYALDTEEGMLEYLRQRLTQEGLKNVRVLHVPPHDPLLVDGSLDLAFLCNVYHHIEERTFYLRKLRKALKPTGRLVLIDFYPKETPAGPPPHMRLSEETVRQELGAAGFQVREKLDLLPYQYLFIATPAKGPQRP